MIGLFLVTLSNAHGHHKLVTERTESASSLVRAQMEKSEMDFGMAIEAIEARRTLPDEVKPFLNKQHRRLRRVSLTQDKDDAKADKHAKGKQEPDADTLRKLDKARVILNEMYEGSQEELDVIIWDCRTFIHSQVALMDENTRLRTMMGAEAARAKAAEGAAKAPAADHAEHAEDGKAQHATDGSKPSGDAVALASTGMHPAASAVLGLCGLVALSVGASSLFSLRSRINIREAPLLG